MDMNSVFGITSNRCLVLTSICGEPRGLGFVKDFDALENLVDDGEF